MEFPCVWRCGYPHRTQASTRIGTSVPLGDNRSEMGQRVLIVDDHAGFRASARRMLECDGFEVVGEAADGAEAVEAARELLPDVVLVDVGLPDCDGRDLADELGTNAHVAVVLISSRDDVESGGEALGFIPKDRLSGRAIKAMMP
jgi:DNA-binding NarL/FixJ family response regulator